MTMKTMINTPRYRFKETAAERLASAAGKNDSGGQQERCALQRRVAVWSSAEALLLAETLPLRPGKYAGTSKG